MPRRFPRGLNLAGPRPRDPYIRPKRYLSPNARLPPSAIQAPIDAQVWPIARRIAVLEGAFARMMTLKARRLGPGPRCAKPPPASLPRGSTAQAQGPGSYLSPGNEKSRICPPYAPYPGRPTTFAVPCTITSGPLAHPRAFR